MFPGQPGGADNNSDQNDYEQAEANYDPPPY